ncbi:ABC-type transport auxiliary lipoprotein family protein [Sphingomonas mesophila]|uniref:ABC-type transport auxiliary lipoprotein family protein n=1 Tax=Sphingomonas mesophila TaxID=2303576 RepID=UPI000E572B8F|nr:ABC-type transport auxiliary lipoprotein family protein [Sphingomonas mesophila]
MRQVMRAAAAALMVAALSGCALMGGKAPKNLITLSATAPSPGPIARSGNAAETVTVEDPIVAKEIRTTRVAAQTGSTVIAYIKDLTLVDTPDKLMKNLIAETILRTTNRVVLDPKQSSLDPGLLVSGRLTDFGYEGGQGTVLVRYDAALSTAGGTRVETRRFEARAPANGTAATVGPALNQAANEVAGQVAQWVGNGR